MIQFNADEELEKIGLSKDDFYYNIDNHVFYHWSGICVTREVLVFFSQPFLAALARYVENLPDKEETLTRFRRYQECHVFVGEVKNWIKARILEEIKADNLTDFRERDRKYQEKRREYIAGWKRDEVWHPKQFTSKIPTDIKKAAIEAWDFVLNYQANLVVLPITYYVRGESD